MTTLDWALIVIILVGLLERWICKDSSDYRELTDRLKRLERRHEEAYAKMRSSIDDEGERVEELLKRCKDTMESLHGTDMTERTKEWQRKNPEEMERIERKRELKRNPYGY